MARTYRLTPTRRLLNVFIRALLALGIAPGGTYLLIVTGRKTGRRYSTPVTLVERGSERWLVAPYGEVGWVRNARAAGTVELRRGRRVEQTRIEELGPEERAPVLKEYVRKVSVVRPYFDASPDSPLEDFAAEAARHPVFRLAPA